MVKLLSAIWMEHRGGIARLDSTNWQIWDKRTEPGWYNTASCITVLGVGNGDTTYYSNWYDSFPGSIYRIVNGTVAVHSDCAASNESYDMKQLDTALAVFRSSIRFYDSDGNCTVSNPGIGCWSIYWDYPGWFILGTRYQGVIMFNGTDTIHLPIISDSLDFSNSNINALSIEPDASASTGLGGKLWFAYLWQGQQEHRSGIGIWDGQKVEIVKADKTGISNYIGHLKRHPDGSIWVGSLNGLACYRNRQWTTFKAGDSFLPNNTIADIEFDALGNTWIATPGGLAVYNPQGVIFSPRPVVKPEEIFKVYPNPADDKVTIEFWTDEPGAAQLNINSINGSTLFSDIFQLDNTGLSTRVIDLINVPAGLYIVSLLINQQIHYSKLIKY